MSKVRPRRCTDRARVPQKVYLLSTLIAMVGCIIAALSKTIGVLIGMRCFQAVGCVPLTSC